MISGLVLKYLKGFLLLIKPKISHHTSKAYFNLTRSSPDTSTTYRSPYFGHSAIRGMLEAFVFVAPATLDNSCFFNAWGSTSAGNSNQWMSTILATDGTLRHRVGGSWPVLSGDLRGQTNVVVVNRKTNGDVDYYINSETVTITVNPVNLLGSSVMQHCYMFGENFAQSDNATGMKLRRNLIRDGQYNSGVDATTPGQLSQLLSDLYGGII